MNRAVREFAGGYVFSDQKEESTRKTAWSLLRGAWAADKRMHYSERQSQPASIDLRPLIFNG